MPAEMSSCFMARVRTNVALLSYTSTDRTEKQFYSNVLLRKQYLTSSVQDLTDHTDVNEVTEAVKRWATHASVGGLVKANFVGGP